MSQCQHSLGAITLLPKASWKPKQSSVKLGDVVRDGLSEAVGVASGKSIGLDGQVHFIIEQPGLTQDGEPKAPFYAGAAKVVVVDRRELKVSKDSIASSGGPMARSAIGR